MLSSSAQAKSMLSKEAVFNCENAQTERDMRACAQRHLDKSDDELNRIYSSLMVDYKGDKPPGLSVKARSEYLRNVQREWIKFRDKSCELETYDSIGGSGFGTIYTFCLLKYTQERVRYLRELHGSP